ncbi:hypothetical protein DUI87_31201 [Hirundo rustica rustica]|uniref:CCHC-type domain-containing protein n=1 Tax=Hirundo rustica rustica TaxID=333673 RepID=A0A3M0IV50_HIRRU|nr:hypothetical protein DUI87_31201 [Hirundo rustica rustica]
MAHYSLADSAQLVLNVKSTRLQQNCCERIWSIVFITGVCGKFNETECCIEIDDYGETIRDLAAEIKRVAHVPVQKWNSVLQASWWDQLFGQEKLRDAQQSPVSVPQEKEKETKQDEVKPQNQVDPGKDEAALKLQTQQSIPVSDKTQIPGAGVFSATDWTEIRKKALKGETLNMMGSRNVAMPVTYDAQDANPRWKRLDHEVIKDLMKAIRDNGLGSPYFKQLLKGTFNIYDLTPFDLKSLASMILTDSQFIIWEAKWRRALNELRDKYQGGTNAGFTVAQLAGDPPLDNPARQARHFPRELLTDIKNAARKAMVQIPLTGVTESSYTDIKQGPSESFTSFINSLMQAVDRQVSDDWVKPHLIRCLAFANANPECKRVISAMPGQPTMAEILEACSKVGTMQHIATVLGDQVEKAVEDAFANFQQRQVCYKCGKQWHFKKDCPKLAKITSSPDFCPRCGIHTCSA